MPLSHRALLLRLGERARLARLAVELSRRALSGKSGVPESTIKRFELSGEIGTSALLSILITLGISPQLEDLFAPQEPRTIADLAVRTRIRGRRSDFGAHRAKAPRSESKRGG